LTGLSVHGEIQLIETDEGPDGMGKEMHMRKLNKVCPAIYRGIAVAVMGTGEDADREPQALQFLSHYIHAPLAGTIGVKEITGYEEEIKTLIVGFLNHPFEGLAHLFSLRSPFVWS